MNLFGGFNGGCNGNNMGGCDCCSLIFLILLLQNCGCGGHNSDNVNFGGCDCCTLILLLLLLCNCGCR